MAHMFDVRGSLWRKWDLHVHTPASLVQGFPSSGEDAWSAYLDDLEALPPEFQVLGINDYFFVDGYERLLQEKAQGRIPNIDLLLPIIELRLNVFGGTTSNLSKVNAHVIFSNELSPEVIRDQFISALASSFTLSPKYSDLVQEWSGVLTRSALDDLGRAIIGSVPENQRDRFGTPLMEGFGNLTISLEKLEAVLGRSYFRGRTLLGVGKTEWADVKWSDGSIADKKNVINKADVVFISAESPPAYHQARHSLTSAGVNDRLLDCSDAHYPSTSEVKDRVGNASTWIKASPTFCGLRQALQEFEKRVFVGTEPPQVSRVREHRYRYIDRVELRRVPSANLQDTWFDSDLPLNSGLVAVIGNRGSGKSALAEAIGLAGNSSREEDFTFLHPTKFREPRYNPSRYFVARLRWGDGEQTSRLMSESPDPSDTVLVQHLPQKYLETLCNDVPKGEKTEFDRELERIIFSHLPEENRLGADTMEERIKRGSRSTVVQLKAAREVLSRLNERIVDHERALRPEAARARLTMYRSIRREWYQASKGPPKAVPKPVGSDPDRENRLERIRDLTIAEAHLRELMQNARERLGELRRRTVGLVGFKKELEALAAEHSELMKANEGLLRAIGLDLTISTFEIDQDKIDQAEVILTGMCAEIEGALAEGNERSFPSAIKLVTDEAVLLRKQLAAPDERYQEYLKQYREWKERVRQLLGSVDTPNSVLGARANWTGLQALPTELGALKAERRMVSEQIHKLLLDEAETYSHLYGPLEMKMTLAPVPPEYQLKVDSSLVDAGFVEQFLEERINRQVAGSFCGKEVSLKTVKALLEAADLNDTTSVMGFVEAIDARMHLDHRSHPYVQMNVETQLRKGQTVKDLYDFLFGLQYLSPRFVLRFGTRPIHLLSPGEKGVLLLIFFLLAETNTRPLIIDQPEDNLDNQTVFKALVRCFQEARSKRQVIIVTHNPNLAVVCDADQVIVAIMDKDHGNSVHYKAGPIEDPEISQAIVDVLEGTRPAFENRSAKYDLHAPAK